MDRLFDRRGVIVFVAAFGVATFVLLAPAMAGAVVAGLASGTAFWFILCPAAPAPAPAPPAAPPEPGLAAVAATIDEPLLFVERMQVTHANAAATALLGEHIVGEDARLAIRHPAAGALFTGAEGRLPTQPIVLGAIGGGVGRHWEMAIHPVGEGGLLVRLADRSEARAAERMRVDFVANASHELRTPLATLLGYIETLQMANGPEDAATRLRFLNTMFGEGKRMQRLIEDLMSLSRIEAEQHSAPQDAVALDSLAAEVRDAIASARSVERDRIEIAVDGAAPVAGDRAQLSQLLHNLIGNALKYGRPGGAVQVRVAREAAGLRLSVTDEGAGIPREHLPRLTERFYRVDPGRSRAVGGTGLGLAIVKHIAERHRARLDIASVVGQGTTVSVLFPLPGEALSSKSHTIVTQDASKASIGTPKGA
ncbi:ATP-binding protein [Sphingomonas solaris]|uniref:histidine kinase n=1 Tax=Alterirhizorhabdus solaris TaxID=2529389 RepID=A0A558R0V9_9SPHN|nr:ATP-binding protein [Sphingomonas solaris]TVV72999.1 ATPase [Sphingomonas solaris]